MPVLSLLSHPPLLKLRAHSGTEVAVNPTNKRSPRATTIPQPLNRQAPQKPQLNKPVVAQRKTAVPVQGIKRPGAPPVYRPEQKRVAQPKMAVAPARTVPKTTPVYRPQPVPKFYRRRKRIFRVLSLKTNVKTPAVPPAPRPTRQPATLQKKAVASHPSAKGLARQMPVAPPVHARQQTPRVLQRSRGRVASPPRSLVRTQNPTLNPATDDVVQASWGTFLGAVAGVAVGGLTASFWVPAAIVSAGVAATGATAATVTGVAGAAIAGVGGVAIGYNHDRRRRRPPARRPPPRPPSQGGAGPSSGPSSSSEDNEPPVPPVLSNREKFEQLTRTLDRLLAPGAKPEHRSVLGWPKYGQAKHCQIRSVVCTVSSLGMLHSPSTTQSMECWRRRLI